MRFTAIGTQLVFEHGLRVRVKVETSSSTRTTPTLTPEAHSEATTPDNVSIVSDITLGSFGSRSGEGGSLTTSSCIKGKQKEASPASPTSDLDNEDPGRSSTLVGKMNNLVSTDLDNIIEGWDFLVVGSSLVHTPFSIPLMKSTCSLVSSLSSRLVHLVLVQHPRLECICRVDSDGFPLPCSWHHRKQNTEGSERDHETSKG
jgi:hypothetical protein